MRKSAYLICLLLLLNGCSFFQRVPEHQVRFDLDKTDRPDIAPFDCYCLDPDPMVLPDVEPYKTEEAKGAVLMSNEDYNDMSDITDQDIKWMKQTRSMKRCWLRCQDKYNRYINRVNNE